MVQTTQTQDNTLNFYELDWRIDHLIGDLKYDVWLKTSSEWEDISDVLDNRKNLILPEPIEFESLEEDLAKTDYPSIVITFQLCPNKCWMYYFQSKTFHIKLFL